MRIEDIAKLHGIIEDMLLNGEYNRLNNQLERIKVDSSDTDELITYLTATRPARSKLTNRPGFYKRVEEELKKREEWEEGLLGGLE